MQQPTKSLQQYTGAALITGAAALVLSAAGFLFFREAFASAYLIAYLFWLGITLGCFPLIMFYHLTGGNWGFPIVRIAEHFLKMIPLMAVLFIPVFLCRYELYEWTHADVVAHDPILQHKAEAYLNIPFFLVRLAIYFVIWFAMAYFLHRWSRDYEKDHHNEKVQNKLQLLSGTGLILFGLTVTFSSIDWVMSLEPHWFSTIYGLLFMAGDTLAALCGVILVAIWARRHADYGHILTRDRTHDLGSLLFTFVMVWAYVNLSQFIIIWSGNLKEEAPWYLIRFQGSWSLLSIAITLFHFFVPFFLLLMRRVKRSFRSLIVLSSAILVMRYADLYWYIKPVFRDHLSFHWLDLVTWIGIGGIWFGFLFIQLKDNRFSLAHDPMLKQGGKA